MYRNASDYRRDWITEFGLQHGEVRADNAVEFGMILNMRKRGNIIAA